MIAKRAARRNDGRSSFGKLARYILAERGGAAAQRDARATNCGAESVDTALAAIAATQALNTRTRNDKTYHLIVSFRAGENPAPHELAIIEASLCGAIGLGDHQRLSVLHEETGNPHLHVAINKIHPETLRAVEPYYDHRALGAACEQLERRFGLARDNHAPRVGLSKPPARAADMRAHAGLESFSEWTRGHAPGLRDAIGRAATWDEAHTALARFDIELRPRGAGLALAARSHGATVKASAVDRAFSYAALTARFGPYAAREAATAPIAPEFAYAAAPDQRPPTLWAEYQAARALSRDAKAPVLARARADRETAAASIRADFDARRARVRADPLLSRRAKRGTYIELATQRASAYASARMECKQAITDAHRRHRLKPWQDWLIDRALEGDKRALRTLRSRVRSRGTEAFGLSGGPGGDEHAVHPDLRPRVLGNGDILYTIDGQRVRDTGSEIRVDSTAAPAIAAALELARRKWPGPLALAGGETFRDAVAQTAAASPTPVAFADPQIERRRSLIASLTTSELARRQQLVDWVRRRNETRARTSARTPLRVHRPGESGTASYRGIRRVGGSSAALLETPDEILVLPLSPRQASRFRREPIGAPLRFDSRGRCTFTRGRTL